jgi:hypothetical protein
LLQSTITLLLQAKGSGECGVQGGKSKRDGGQYVAQELAAPSKR